jgi:hypothetical protein
LQTTIPCFGLSDFSFLPPLHLDKKERQGKPARKKKYHSSCIFALFHLFSPIFFFFPSTACLRGLSSSSSDNTARSPPFYPPPINPPILSTAGPLCQTQRTKGGHHPHIIIRIHDHHLPH